MQRGEKQREEMLNTTIFLPSLHVTKLLHGSGRVDVGQESLCSKLAGMTERMGPKWSDAHLGGVGFTIKFIRMHAR